MHCTGKKILEESGLPIITAKDLDEAAQKAVASLPKEEKSDEKKKAK